MTGRAALLGLGPGFERLLAGPHRNSPETTLEAARQFEALLLQQLLRTMREAVEKENPDSADGLSGGETYLELAEQHLAQAMAARGGFGMARLIARGLESAATQVYGGSVR